MSKKSNKNPFPTAPASKLLETFVPCIYLDHPDRMCSLLMKYGAGKTYSVPIEVARMIHSQLGKIIDRAARINHYKAEYRINPAWPCDV